MDQEVKPGTHRVQINPDFVQRIYDLGMESGLSALDIIVNCCEAAAHLYNENREPDDKALELHCKFGNVKITHARPKQEATDNVHPRH